MIGILVVTHGRFGTELVKTALDIMGKSPFIDAVDAIPPIKIEDLQAKVRAVVKEFSACEDILIMVDTPGGTPCNACLTLRGEFRIELVTGVNLPMALSAVANRDRMTLEELALKVAEDARKTIFNGTASNNISVRST